MMQRMMSPELQHHRSAKKKGVLSAIKQQLPGIIRNSDVELRSSPAVLTMRDGSSLAGTAQQLKVNAQPGVLLAKWSNYQL